MPRIHRERSTSTPVQWFSLLLSGADPLPSCTHSSPQTLQCNVGLHDETTPTLPLMSHGLFYSVSLRCIQPPVPHMKHHERCCCSLRRASRPQREDAAFTDCWKSLRIGERKPNLKHFIEIHQHSTTELHFQTMNRFLMGFSFPGA